MARSKLFQLQNEIRDREEEVKRLERSIRDHEEVRSKITVVN
jgi:hypothetical protein